MFKPSTLVFLKNLKSNNDRTWFEAHRSSYLAAKEDFENFTGQLIKSLSAADESLKDLQAKDCVFRIHRDVRFSKNKTPYKTNMGAYLCKGGKKSNYGGYYFQLEPGNTFMGGGLWMPPSPDLKKVRQEVDYCFPELKKLLNRPGFKKVYGDLSRSEEYTLVKVPKEYDKENPAAEYLKLKGFVATTKFDETLLTKPALLSKVTKHFEILIPLVHFFNRALD